ncbi:MAG: HEAT repeat domain-containing protein [Gemmatimonadetes bacterium]|nr:HEAT repeat domain-containing protein [Gemmatimonadota bacterium]
MIPRILPLALGIAASTLVAQEPPPRPAPVPRAAPAPRPTPSPRVLRAPRAAIAPMPAWPDGLPFIDREAWAAEADHWRAEAEAQVALHKDEWAAHADRLRAEAEAQVNLHRGEWEMDARRMAEDMRIAIELDGMPTVSVRRLAPMAPLAPFPTSPRPAWARTDQGDSLYRRARELLNSGEYRRAATTFRDLSTKVPNSSYAPDALYWQAFALYRIGGTDELRTALEAIDQLKAKYPAARMRSETEALGVRIRGALAARGDAASAALIRTTAADSMLRCDREEQSVRAEALNALTQNDPAGAMPLLQRTLARKDACSAALRRTAVFLMGSKRAEGSQAALTTVARTDPSTDVRTAAIEWLARFPGEGSLGTIEELARDSSDRVSRAATRALVTHPSPRARTLVRSLVERAETPEKLRLEALSAFDRERATAEDVTWMRTLHGKTENPKIRSRLVSTLSNIGGPEVDQWLLALSRDPEVDSDTRRTALRRVGRTLPIADLARTYDASAERSVREGVIDVLRERTEAEATDKLIDIVKRGTDPQLRSRAISALTSKKDPRTIRLLMEILDK